MNQFRRLQGGRGIRQTQISGKNSINVQSGGSVNMSIPSLDEYREARIRRNTYQGQTLFQWWDRLRVAFRWMPFYNVNWNKLAEQAFDLKPLDEQTGWKEVEEYGNKIALLKETFDVGDLYPSSAGREMGGPGSADGSTSPGMPTGDDSTDLEGD